MRNFVFSVGHLQRFEPVLMIAGMRISDAFGHQCEVSIGGPELSNRQLVTDDLFFICV